MRFSQNRKGPFRLIPFILLLSLSFGLKLNQNPGQSQSLLDHALIEDSQSIQTLQESQNQHKINNKALEQGPLKHILFETNHYASSSMPINYTQEIIKLSGKLKPAADINERIMRVQKYILGHEEQIQIIGNFTFSELNTEGINCKNTSTDTIQALSFRTTQMKEYLQNSLNVNQVNFITDRSKRQSTEQKIQEQVIYLKGIQKFLQSGCSSPVKLQKTYFISNPNANNWVLGSQTYDQFIRSYVQTMNSQQKINKCSVKKPYFDSITTKECINCQYPNNIWDMKQGLCKACPYGQIVNLKTRKCVSQIKYVNNIRDQNYPWITKQKDLHSAYEQFRVQKSDKNSIVCPFDTPFILNEKCSTCPQKSVYLLQSKKCIPIPYNLQYDRNLHKIVQRIYNYQTDQSISSNIYENLKSCPAKYPYFDNITCIDCVFPNYFNQKRKKCQPCVNLDFCGSNKLKYVTNSLGSNVTASTTQQVKKYFDQNAQKIKDDSVQQCAITQPYYNPSQRRCVRCPFDRPLFNISTLACVTCPQGTGFNQSSYLCQKPKGVKTYSKVGSLVINDVTSYRKQQSMITGQQCQQSLPYFNGKQCISCPLNQLFNTTSKICVKCPPNTSYDSVQFKCNTIKYKTNSLTDQLWILNVSDYQTKYKNNTAKQCPIQTPFYNGVACIKCPNEGEIYNTSSLKCTTCPDKTIFNSIDKNCSLSKSKFYVPGKTGNLVGVPSYTVEKYLLEIKNVNNNTFDIIKCLDDQNSKKSGCVKCPENLTFFNVKTLKCVACKNFSLQLKICLDRITYLTNTTNKDGLLGASQGDVQKYVTDQQTKLKSNIDLYLVCPSDKPFSVKGVCQACQKYFNVSSSVCTTCDNLDYPSKTCQSQPFVSNLKYGVPSYYTKDLNKLLEDYDKSIKSDTPVCPFPTPFFNGRQCIVCPKTDQYFNIDLRRCQNCTTGYQFNTIINECQEQPPKFYTSLNSSKLIFDDQPIAYYNYKIEQAKKAGSTECPKNRPYYTKQNTCQSCPQPNSYFNLLRRICTHCPQKTTYVEKDHQCESAIGDIVTLKATLEKSLANLFT